MRLFPALTTLVMCFALVAGQAQPPSVLSPRSAADSSSTDGLGPEFKNELLSIAFRPPSGLVRNPTSDDGTIEFLDTARHWKLTLTTVKFERDVPLVTPKKGLMVGFLEERTEKLKENKKC